VSVSTDPRYRPLASTAIAAMGAQASSSMVAAIVSQWQCEQPTNAWPPRRNNPGNVARGWAAAVGIPYTVEFPNPQPSNPIVTYASAADGARAYGIGIRSFSRYSSALAYARGGDGARYLRALLVGTGYGTSYTCAASVFARLGGQAAGGDVVPASSPGALAADLASILGKSTSDLFTQADSDKLYAWVQARGVPLPYPVGDLGTTVHGVLHSSFDAQVGKTVGQAGAALSDTLGSIVAGGSEWAGKLADPVAGAIAGIPAAIGGVLAHMGQFAVIAALLLMGLWLVATSGEAEA
jgi:hypothetical protein